MSIVRRSHPRRFLPLLGALALAAGPVRGQSLAGRSAFEVRLGAGARVHAGTSVSTGGVETDAEAGGALFGLGYMRWFDEADALAVSMEVRSMDAGTRVGVGGVSVHSGSVVAFLVGLRRYGPRSTFTSPWRPWMGVEAGATVGSESGTDVGPGVSVRASSSTAVAARGSLGIDRLLGSRWGLGFAVGYTLMSRFDEPVAGERDHSGPNATLSLSFRFGGG